ncbi:MAG: radical SAM protein [bacterium]|nr:radical SAM protein [bacterium]
MIRYTKVPHSVRLLLTHRCNLHCDFCFMDASDEENKKELTTTEWLTFFDRLKQLLIFNISISGGEIFLRDDLFILLKKLRENRIHKITLLTNGTLITKDSARQLQELKIKNISISLDGLEEKHNQIRGKNAFQKTVKGIQHLSHAGILPNVAFTPIKSNYSDLGPLIDLAVSLGIPTISVNTLTPEGRCLNIYGDIALKFPDQIKETLDIVEEKKKEYPQIKINCSLGFHYHLPQSYRYFQENPQNYEIKHLKDGCGAASTSCTITSTGDVIPCEGLADFIGGNIKDRDLSDIWNNSEKLKTIRDLGKISMDRVPHCKDCKYIYLCDGGCRASAYMVHNDLLAPGITCPLQDRQDLKGVKNHDHKKSNRIPHNDTVAAHP